MLTTNQCSGPKILHLYPTGTYSVPWGWILTTLASRGNGSSIKRTRPRILPIPLVVEVLHPGAQSECRESNPTTVTRVPYLSCWERCRSRFQLLGHSPLTGMKRTEVDLQEPVPLLSACMSHSSTSVMRDAPRKRFRLSPPYGKVSASVMRFRDGRSGCSTYSLQRLPHTKSRGNCDTL